MYIVNSQHHIGSPALPGARSLRFGNIGVTFSEHVRVNLGEEALRYLSDAMSVVTRLK